MRASVGHQHTKAVLQQDFRIADCAEAIVSKPMQENDGVAIAALRVNIPSAERNTVGRMNFYVINMRALREGQAAHITYRARIEWTMVRAHG